MPETIRIPFMVFFCVAALVFGGCADTPGTTQPTTAPLAPTPESVDDDDPGAPASTPTPSMTEGPFFKPSSPERASLLDAGMKGERLTITGRVLDTAGKPVPGALLDFWQADADGEYDNAGFRLRGHQFTSERGEYRLRTITPGNYPGRTSHIHVKVQAPRGRVLTTQLFFPDDPRNGRDRIFDPRLVLRTERADGEVRGEFDFIVETGK